MRFSRATGWVAGNRAALLLVGLGLLAAGARRAGPAGRRTPGGAGVPWCRAAGIPLGVSYSGWKGGFPDAAQRLETFRAWAFPS